MNKENCALKLVNEITALTVSNRIGQSSETFRAKMSTTARVSSKYDNLQEFSLQEKHNRFIFPRPKCVLQRRSPVNIENRKKSIGLDRQTDRQTEPCIFDVAQNVGQTQFHGLRKFQNRYHRLSNRLTGWKTKKQNPAQKRVSPAESDRRKVTRTGGAKSSVPIDTQLNFTH